MSRPAGDPLTRYLAKVAIGGPDECWPWTAGCFDSGYGAFRVGQKLLKAHRFGYETVHGPIPEGRIVCHSCDNTLCQNPRHWFLGTHKDNADDRDRKGRGRYPRVNWPAKPRPGRARGERHGRSRVTADDVLAIRSRAAAGESQDSLAAAFKIAQATVSKIVTRRSWTHV